MEENFNAVEKFGLVVQHVGINADGPEDAARMAEEFRTLMGFIPRFGEKGIFASDLIEIIKEDGPGVHGHIAIGARDFEGALEYFKSTMGIDEELTEKYNPGRKNKFYYLGKQIGGFAIHLKPQQ